MVNATLYKGSFYLQENLRSLGLRIRKMSQRPYSDIIFINFWMVPTLRQEDPPSASKCLSKMILKSPPRIILQSSLISEPYDRKHLSYFSWNVIGIDGYKKRRKIVNWMVKHSSVNSILMLQETHSTPNDEENWRKQWRSKLFSVTEQATVRVF